MKSERTQVAEMMLDRDLRLRRYEDALRALSERADRLANSLALVCGSSAVPAKMRKPLEAVAEDVRGMQNAADAALAEP